MTITKKYRSVEVPQLIGDFLTTKRVIVEWTCPVCGGERGEVARVLSYDGSLRVHCDGWVNPCGHIDKYADVIKEAAALAEYDAQQPVAEAADDISELEQALNANAALQARIEQLEAMLQEAAQVLAPIVDAVEYDSDLMKVRDIAMIYVLNSDGDEYVQIETESGFLEARHLRAVAQFASKLAALSKPAK